MVDSGTGGVIYPWRGRLVHAEGRGHGVVVVTEGEVAYAFLFRGKQDALGPFLAAQSGGAVRFVGHQDSGRYPRPMQGVRYGSATLVGAEDDADPAALQPLSNPSGDLRRVGGYFSFHH